MKTNFARLFLGAALAAAPSLGAHLRKPLAREQHTLAASLPKSNSSLLQVALNLEADAKSMITDLLAGQGTSLREAVHHVHDKMQLQDAVQRLQGKLPDEVSSLLKLSGQASSSKTSGDFSEESLAKARVILNGMVENSFAELDDVIIDCKAFENMNRVTFGQVRTDIARLGSEIAEADEKGTTNYNCVEAQDGAYKGVDGTLTREKNSYLKIKAENDAEMTIKKNDLAVFNFIMELTKCADSGTTFLQMGANNSAPVQVCSTKDGFELDLHDPKLQAKMSKIMTPGAKMAVRDALGLAFAGKVQMPVLLQRSSANQSASTGAAETTSIQMTLTLEPVPVKEEPPASTQWKKCTDGPVNCGLLHDTMSLQWGKFKDLVDELQAEMDRNDDEWETLKGNLNEQMRVISETKGECQTQFDAAVGAKNTLTEESNEKNEQERELDEHYEKYMAVCHARIEELLFTDVCAVRKVRNEVMKSSTIAPPDKITDCDVKDWVAQPCSVPCDDTCPHLVGGQVDPYSCGGTQTLNRGIIVNANEFGIKCPLLSKQTRCSQFKCSVDCALSEWSGWSKCTKECEGGARQMTRSVMVKPKHGGKACDSPVTTEACHTMSCDRNCRLDEWTGWSPCSMACNPGGMPGFQERVRKVLVPTRGEGTCPMEDNTDRYEKQVCNSQPCIGDEICIARQDLIIALDASGSLKETGFEILRDFAANLTGSYQPMYYGEPTVQIGVILFGNGAINSADNTIAPATHVIGLTGDLALVKEKIEATTWQRGFTNMAQAFVLADTMFQQGGRAEAQSAVLVFSDGKYSFAFETEQAVNKLKEKSTQVFMAPVAAMEGEWQHKMKEWASQPWETNYEFLPGLDAVKHNMNTFSAALVAKFCSDAISPSLEMAKDDQKGYMLIHEGGFPSNACGRWINLGLVESQEECVEKSEQVEYQAYSITEPQKWYKGKRHCYGEAIEVTPENWKVWQGDKVNIPCDSGRWLNNPWYDVYAIEPVTV